MAGTAFAGRILVSVLLFALASTTLANPVIIAGMEDAFLVTCDSSSTSWAMRVGALERLEVPGGDSIKCKFAYTDEGGAYFIQNFYVAPTDAAGVQCDVEGCQWTVKSDGFYVHDTLTAKQVFEFQWESWPSPP